MHSSMFIVYTDVFHVMLLGSVMRLRRVHVNGS